MSGLDSLYQELILDHSKRRAGYGLADESVGTSATSHQRNPVCGDEITLRVRVQDDVVLDVTWEGAGCAISQASASMLAALVEEDGGMPRAEASALIDGFRDGDALARHDPARRGDLLGCLGPERRLALHRAGQVRDARLGRVRGRPRPRLTARPRPRCVFRGSAGCRASVRRAARHR